MYVMGILNANHDITFVLCLLLINCAFLLRYELTGHHASPIVEVKLDILSFVLPVRAL